jgi:hypothetical protein
MPPEIMPFHESKSNRRVIVMKATICVLLGILFPAVAFAGGVAPPTPALATDQMFRQDDLRKEMPISLSTGTRADTFWFGDYTYLDGFYYARCLGKNQRDAVAWTFDRGNGPGGTSGIPLIEDPLVGRAVPNGEGWFVRDLTENSATYWRAIDGTLDLGNYPAGMGGGPVPPPILSGSRSLWVGADNSEARAMCWPGGAGYGGDWCQRITSGPVAYNGTGTVKLTLTYFSQTEKCYDSTQIYLLRADNEELRMNPYTGDCHTSDALSHGFTGAIGIDSMVPPGTPILLAPVTWTTSDFTAADITGGAQNIRFIIEFYSDYGLSDQDGYYDTIWSGFGCDNVTISGTGVTPRTYTFETGLEGWSPGFCTSVGDFVDIVDLDPLVYVILDPCACRLHDHILEMAAYDYSSGQFLHPDGQHIYVSSPICDLTSQNPNGMPQLKTIFLSGDIYAEIPQGQCVVLRTCWRFYPYLCEVTQTNEWSPVIGPSAWSYVGLDPVCRPFTEAGTDPMAWGSVPASAEKVIAILELWSSSIVWGGGTCAYPSNFSPLYDNLVVGVTGGSPNAPSLTFDAGGYFQDVGSYPSTLFDVRAPGPANVVFDAADAPDEPRVCGDNLTVYGPMPSSDPNTRWEARLWWRVAKRGAFQADKENGVDTAYKTWKTRVADGLQIDRPYRPEFTFGWMDSIQSGPVPQKNHFLARFSEKDDDFLGESKLSDMLPDDVFRPGTRIEYFLTSNYTSSPNDRFYLPDTSGGYFLEFEILPGVRTAYVANCGGSGLNYCAYHPATLFINSWCKWWIEAALRTILNGYPPCVDWTSAGCLNVPPDRNWDRYDYLDASSSWCAPFARGFVSGSNNGMTLNQILGYRTILMYTGAQNFAMEDEDFFLFDQWLVSPDCSANVNRQLLVMNGNRMGEVMERWPTYGLPFLNNTLGATLFCDAFNGVTSDPECWPEEHAYCVRLQQVGASAPYFPTLIDVDAFGSWCPSRLGFNVYTPDTDKGGIGNRIYQAEEGGKSMSYEQVIRYNSSPNANYKTVLDGVGWDFMTRRNAAGSGMDKCPREVADMVEGPLAEIRAAMRWGFDAANDSGIPKLANVKDLAVCENTWTLPTGMDDAGPTWVNRLFQNEPNPFSPRTTIKFSLAQSGPVEIVIYDVNGRQVRKLVDERMDPGFYSVVWDGTNDSSHRVGSGVYWSQMKAGSFVSNKKLVVLK